jgi:DNA-binding GntR family transcriptional regulator
MDRRSKRDRHAVEVSPSYRTGRRHTIRAMGADPARRLDARPLTEQARDALLAAIRAGTFVDGRLPPEGELAESFGVSRTTIRAALQSLAADGLISRQRRHGTFVNAHLLRASMRLNRLVPFSALIRQLGYEPSVDAQTRHVEAAGPEVAEALDIEPETDCLVVGRLLRADGEPVITVVDIVPLERLAVAPEDVVDSDSTFDFLAANGVEAVDYATSEFIPRVATGAGPEGLDIAPGAPYIELVETHFDRNHGRIAVSRVSVDDSRVRFSLLRRGL